MACIGLLCCLVTRLLPLEQAGQSGYVFFTIGIFKYFHGIIAGRRIRAAHARTTPEDRNALPHQL